MNRPAAVLLFSAFLSVLPAFGKSKPANAGAKTAVSPPKRPAIAKGRFSDPRDGKTYATVVVGRQTWMAQNLDFATPSSACYENKRRGCEEMGRLYGWEEAKAACPSGWHLPSAEDWDALEATVGGKDSAGVHLKSGRGWAGKDANGIDSRGFDAIPSGIRDRTGTFGQVGTAASYWTSSSKFTGGIHIRSLSYTERALAHDQAQKDYGLSVRCVMD